MPALLKAQLNKHVPKITELIQEVTEFNVGLSNKVIAERVESSIKNYISIHLKDVVLKKADFSLTNIPSTFSMDIAALHRDSPDLVHILVFCSGAKNKYLMEIVEE